MMRLKEKQAMINTAKILVIDDNPETVELAAINLEMEGYEVYSASNGEEGLKLAEMMPDVILLDVMMPGIDGLEVCRRLKGNPQTGDILVIMLTARTTMEDILKGFEGGADEYITKPFKVEELLARVRSMVRIKKAQDELKGLNETLEEKVAEKTAMLEDANRKLANLEKAKSDFLILLSHELRTPLHGILGFSELLMDTLSSEDQIDSCRMIVESGQRLLRLSETAILLTSLQIEKYDFTMEDIPVEDIMEDVFLRGTLLAREKRIELTEDTSIGDEFLKGDRTLMARCLTDVLDNAAKFAPEGGRVAITSIVKNETLLIEITDNGPGFSKEALDQLFDLFSPGKVYQHKEGGGLSLAAAKIIMDIHAGSIHAENRPEGGALVRLMLPVC